MHLDEALVLQQLRYTGMLETVRIRRSGYGAKYTFQVLYTYSLNILMIRRIETDAILQHVETISGVEYSKFKYHNISQFVLR